MIRHFSQCLGRSLLRSMGPSKPPTDPIVVIFGSTGTGKSELAVELAIQHNGEIVNADAMQMYRGLPIVTNKIPAEEQRGIPHHLLGNISLDQKPWAVHHFKQEASRVIAEIRSRGRLPIVVGGTHYYINGLLFEDRLVPNSGNTDLDTRMDKVAVAAEFPILDGPTDVLLKKLREVDPVMADRWHPHEHRKIRRSLEIFLTTGRKASEIYAEQRARRESRTAEMTSSRRPLHALFLWLYAKPEILKTRLNQRVENMVDRGLLGEVGDIYRYLQTRLGSGQTVDLTFGIWQSIGFKQFEPYVRALDEDPESSKVDELKAAGLEKTQAANRQYANAQLRDITKKTLPCIREEAMFDRLFLLDSTDLDGWRQNVVEKAECLTKHFLAGEELPVPSELSKTAKDVLTARIEASAFKETLCNKTCEICNTTCVTEERWQVHIQGRRHRDVARRKKRRALVVVPDCLPAGQDPDTPIEGSMAWCADDVKLPSDT